ncbi:uncharacterized protein LOC141587691 [Silene latifolia]|uniref:uncharacterized protein LOC141587691 n=1 Tax=Silene latifolia TaxID=37657 RepID=UPI003D770370
MDSVTYSLCGAEGYNNYGFPSKVSSSFASDLNFATILWILDHMIPKFCTFKNLIEAPLWDDEEYGLLTCKSHLKVLSVFVVPDSVIDYISNTQFNGISRLCYVRLDNDLITALVELWREETHTFHMPFGEAIVTIQDVQDLLGLKITRIPVMGTSEHPWGLVYEELLGRRPSNEALRGGKLKVNWLHDNYQKLPQDAKEETLHQHELDQETTEEVLPTTPSPPVLKLTSVYCYILGAKPPSNVISGFVKRVWQSNRMDRVSFLPNGIFLVRFKTKEQQQVVLNNGHLTFDNNLVIINEWTPEAELLRHDVSRVPIWMKLYDLDIRFWGVDSLKKLSGLVGTYIKCDDATKSKAFLGYARIMVEIHIGQQFSTEINFIDEHGKLQRARVVYDWLPTTCKTCKVLGHTAHICRKEVKGAGPKKVWQPKVAAQNFDKPRPQVPKKQVQQPVQRPNVQRGAIQQTPVVQRVSSTPVTVSKEPVLEQSMPRKILTRLMRNDSGERRLFTPGGLSFMESLNLSLQKSKAGFIERVLVEKGESSKNLADNGYHKEGRIWLIWDHAQFQVNVKEVTAQCIHSEVVDRGRHCSFWLTMIYGFNKLAEREPLWDSLRTFNSRITGPWMACGDFNALKALDERTGGADVTGAEHEVTGKVYSRLDRVFVNEYWVLRFPESYAHFLPEGSFDHCPCLIRFEDIVMTRRPSFKYYNIWSKANDFEEVVQNGWNTEVHGTLMFQVVQKLKCLKQGLKRLNKDQFSDIEKLTNVTELALFNFQKMLRMDPLNVDLCQAEKECAAELEWIQKAWDDYLRQKAKTVWLQSGDENTAFFHAKIKAAFESYYISLLGIAQPVSPVKHNVIKYGKCLTDVHSAILLAPVTAEEIKESMFSIPGNKAPGPDGYSSQFFKDCWHIVGPEVCRAIQNVFESGQLLKQCNNTILTSVPKVDVPESVLQFRPIACCNTVYKCLSKAICARLGKILPDIVSPSQSAFIKGMDIVGNIMICQDLIRLYRRKSCSPRILMKLDLQKAYDSVKWSFVEDVFRDLGFPEHMGDSISIDPILKAFDCFSKTSGLKMNNGKSSFYCNGMNNALIDEVQRRTGMKQGTVPFKYLGVSVSSKKLSVLECNCLVDKIVDKVRSMGSRHLSYAGRLVLVKAVFSTLHNYWARIFILPQIIIKKIEAVCKEFLWHGKELKTSPALIESKANHLWVKWVHAIYIKADEWKSYKPTLNSSWSWRKLCQVKERFMPLLQSGAGLQGEYTVSQGYCWLQPDYEQVVWAPWIMDNWLVPKHGFISWLAGHHRLLTQDRLIRMNVIQTNTCYLCGQGPEEHSHLFFRCVYSNKCRELVSAWCNEQLPD